MTKKIILIIALLLPLPSFAAAPTCLYQDVLSGPASGGERGNGIYLSIFGHNFGSTRGTSTVTVNGTPVAQYIVWGSNNDVTGEHDQISVQIASATTGTGNIVVTTPGGSCSNLSFTVRSGHIYFVGPTIDTSSPGTNCSTILASGGTYASPWGLTNYASHTESSYNYGTMRTPYTYYNCLSLGDTLVFLNGATYPYFDGASYGSSLSLNKAGTSSSFITIQARPGATVQLGAEGWANYGIRDYATPNSYAVISGIAISAASTAGTSTSALEVNYGNRIVGSTITCPNCDGESAALASENPADNITLLGNLVTQVSTDASVLPNGSIKMFHSIYLSGNNLEVGWNRIYNTDAYNGIQINASPPPVYYNLSIHDNDVADVNGTGINFSTVNPSLGYVQAYNNIIHHTGVKVASDGNTDDPHSCIAVKGYYGSGTSGTVNIYNNTMYDCTGYLNHDPGGGGYCAIYIAPNVSNDGETILNTVTTNLVNNIVYQPAYTYTGSVNPYMCGLVYNGKTAHYSGSNNIWYSASTPGSTAYATTIGTIKNPLFVSAANGPWTNYELQSTSPAIGAGIRVGPVESQGISNTNLTWDFQQVTRPNPPSMGALQ